MSKPYLYDVLHILTHIKIGFNDDFSVQNDFSRGIGSDLEPQPKDLCWVVEFKAQ